jgi:hypothetical protein
MNHPVAKPPRLSKAYGSPLPLSTNHVSDTGWKCLQAGLVILLFVIGLGLVLSLSGVGSPAYGWQSIETAGLTAAGERNGLVHWRISSLPTPPFMLEVSLTEPGLPTGIRVTAADEYVFLVDPHGYLSYGPMPDWRPFLHVQPGTNRLLLQVDADGQAIWRVNDEIAWRGQIEAVSSVSALAPISASADDIDLHIYQPR